MTLHQIFISLALCGTTSEESLLIPILQNWVGDFFLPKPPDFFSVEQKICHIHGGGGSNREEYALD